MIEIDGSYGEGGGQILRSSLSLSMVTGKPFRIFNIRGRRSRPGLMRQHLTAVIAAAGLSAAKVSGAEIRSDELVFIPGEVKPGEYHFSIGSAGSTMLVLQTLLPAMAVKTGNFLVTLEGGTHNPLAPSFDFLDQSFIPLLDRMGLKIKLHLHRTGYAPVGGGRVVAEISSSGKLEPVHLLERGTILRKSAHVTVSRLPGFIAEREIMTIQKDPFWTDADCRVVEDKKAPGTGNHITLTLEYEKIRATFCELGSKGIPSEEVARRVLQRVMEFNSSSATVDSFLADQLILPLAIAGSGSLLTTSLSEHTKTGIFTIKCFLNSSIHTASQDNRAWKIWIE